METGTKLGTFEIIGPIGKGGMGEVYRARDTKLGREVAIKVLPKDLADNADYLARFEREAIALATLNHPNIAAIHEFANALPVLPSETETSNTTTHFLVMELVEGDTLADIIDNAALTPGQAISIFIQIAEGLEAAHARRIVHRDLKPANIKITPKGNAKILDFGMAKETGLIAPDIASPQDPTKPMSPSPGTLTTAGMLLGTPNYMSPEQARGDATDKRTDIWAFGCCLYQALTRATPFQGRTVMDIITNVMAAEPDWAKLSPNLPRQLDQLIRRCLEKDPDQRIHDIADARIALTDARDNPEAQPQSTHSRPSMPLVATALIVGLILGGVTAMLALPRNLPADSQSSNSSQSTSPTTAPAIIRFTIDTPADLDDGPVLSPDGTTLIFRGTDDNGIWRLYERRLDEHDAEIRSIPGTERANRPWFSPDGKHIAFAAENRLHRLRLSDSVVEVLVNDDDVYRANNGTWNTMDEIITSQTYAGLWHIDATTGKATQLTVPDRSINEYRHYSPFFLPDGRRFLYNRRSGPESTARTMLYSLDDDSEKELFVGGVYPTYLPTGHIAYALNGALWAAPFDEQTETLLGEPVKILEPLFTYNMAGGAFSFSDNGMLTYFAGGDLSYVQNQMMIVKPDGSSEVISDELARHVFPAATPDGRRLTYMIGERGSSELWVRDLSRNTTFRMNPASTTAAMPVWSPDGTRIAFLGASDQLHYMPVDGIENEIKLTDTEYRYYPTDWTLDGKEIIASRIPPAGSSDIVAINVEDKTERVLVSNGSAEILARISTDSEWIAYQSYQTGRSEIWVKPFDENSTDLSFPITSDGGRDPFWSRDGKTLYFLSNRLESLYTVAVPASPEDDWGLPVKQYDFDFVPSDPGGPAASYAMDNQGNVYIPKANMPADDKISELSRRQIHVVLNAYELINQLAPYPEQQD